MAASVKSPSSYSATYQKMRNMEMRRTAPPVGSRIPVAQTVQTKTYNRHQSAPTAGDQPSRLEKMQLEYQKKLLKEKEQKMINMYEQNQQQALRKVSGKSQRGSGLVRDFFRERKFMEQNGVDLPSRDAHFKRKKEQYNKQQELEENKSRQMKEYQQKVALQQQAQFYQQQQQQHEWQQQQWQQQQHQQWQQQQEELRQQQEALKQQRQQQMLEQQQQRKQQLQLKQQQQHQYILQKRQEQYKQQQKPSRSKLLAPIKHESSPKVNHRRPPSPDGLYETTDKFSAAEDTDWETGAEPPQLMGKNRKPMRAPARQPLKPIGSKARVETSDKDDQIEQRPTQKASMVHRRDVSRKKTSSHPAPHKEEKLSDFQKWQMEQDQQRQERLERHREKQQPKQTEVVDSSFEYDRERHEQRTAHQRRKKEYNDIKSKESELEALIAKHQKELERIKCDDEDDEPDDHQDQYSYRQTSNNPRQSKQKQYTSPYPENSSAMSYSSNYESQLSTARSVEKQPVEIFTKKPAKGPVRKEWSKQQQPQKRKPPQAPPAAENFTPPPLNRDVSFYEQAAQDEGGANQDLNLKGCPNCGRKFAADRIAKHINVCKKQAAAAKKRKTFDMTKKRTEGTEAAQYVKQGRHLKETRPAKKSNWRKKHEDFIQTVQNARMTQDYVNKGGNLADLPPPPPSENPDYKQCPWCSRRFNPTAAERHIPKCKDTKNRPRPPPKKR